MSEGNASVYSDTVHVIITEVFQGLNEVLESTIQIRYILIFSELKIEVFWDVTSRLMLNNLHPLEES